MDNGLIEISIVATPTIIGLVGNTGKSIGSHLHYVVLKEDKPADPKDYVSDYKFE